ncbi:GNAT family N-acetyltransferase [Shewanella woodyi]|uniref:GNAT family N-acetyltransferase n=1 Tax=Shewanella woodyi TaxID=60961 RepID=UPI002D1E350F|nr:GNAT family N-acetyltransferase [Shewanella woodyi]
MIDDPLTFIIVADIDGELASTCSLNLNLSIANGARPFAIIERFITSEKFRRQGLSRQVLEFAISMAWEENCCKVMLLSGEHLKKPTFYMDQWALKGRRERLSFSSLAIKPPS